MADSGLQRVTIDRPFTDGYVSDLRPEQLGPRMAARLENMIFPRGVAERRRGWVYADGGSALAGSDRVHGGVASVAFVRAGATRRMASFLFNGGTISEMRDHTGTFLCGADTRYAGIPLPRTMYRDELLWCYQDGISPILRYGGTPSFSFSSNSGTFTSGERRVTGTTTLPAGFGAGGFFQIVGSAIVDSTRVIVAPYFSLRLTGGTGGGTQYVFERMVWSASGNVSSFALLGAGSQGTAAPCVAVYSTGTVTVPAATSSSTVTGAGTAWNTPTQENVYTWWQDGADGMVITDPASGVSRMYQIGLVSSDTSLGLASGTTGYTSPSSYKILRRMPFKDAAVFRGCLFGAGVKQAQSRLYYCPPGHDIGLPPKYADGRDLKPQAEAVQTSDVAADFEIPWVDVPSSLDADPIVALLPTDSALFVVKRGSAYRITGDYPYFRADKAGDACGCLDIRSAITDETGVYWAGDAGVWTVRGGVPFNLAGGVEGRPGILTEWRNLMSEGITGPTYASTSFIACGVAEGHLIVSVKTASPGTERCFVFDLVAQRWCGKFTRVLPNAMWSSRVPGESDKLYALQNANPRRIIEFSPMFRPGQGSPADGDAGLAPAVAHTGSTFFTGGTVEREHRLVDVDVATRFSSVSTPTGAVDVKVAYGDAVGVAADSTVTAGTIQSDIANVVHRNEFRPGTRGRRHQLQIEQTTVDTDESALEIHEVGGLVRPFGVRR